MRDKNDPPKKRRKLEDNEVIYPNYQILEGFRYVKPYYFTYKTFAKGRWIGRPLLEVLTSEFMAESPKYYQEAIHDGRIRINDEVISENYIIRSGDKLTHRSHRHEPRVPAKDIEIVYDSSDILVVNKPSGMAVHPSGINTFNTLTKILEYEYGFNCNFHLVHRIDIPTSGLVCIAKTVNECREKHQQHLVNKIEKEYLALIDGVFPSEKLEVNKPIVCVSFKLGLRAVYDGSLDKSKLEPEKIKPSKTIFERVSTDGKMSVVRCFPVTGRTHQIRVHLRWLGFPIKDDDLYRNTQIWEPEQRYIPFEELSKRAKTQEKSIQDTKINESQNVKCKECGRFISEGSSIRNKPIYLHALKYSGPGWSHKTQPPDWAIEKK